MKILKTIKLKADELKKEIITIYFAYQHPDLKILPKILIFFTIAYALSPIDLIPDFIPVLGYLDDLIIIPVLINISIKLIPEDIILQSKAKAEKENIKLKRKWFFAVIFIFIWVFVISFMIIYIINKFFN